MFIGKPLFIGMVTAELWRERLLDMLFHPKFEHGRVDESVTAVIKTFERQKEVRRLIKSIRHFYPKMKVVVVDDSKEPLAADGVMTIEMPFDSGVSAGRNLAVRHVETKYLLLLDDDYIFYRKTDLEPAIKKMDEMPEIDIMEGERIDLPLYRTVDNKKASLYPTASEPTLPYGSTIGGLAVQEAYV